MRPQAVVVGAGWAGLAAAERLAADGFAVTVVERLRHAGGRAFSFVDRQTGTVLDNGQHVLLGACRALLALLDRLGLGQAVWLQPALALPVWWGGRWQQISSRPALGRAHLWPVLARYRHLDGISRLRLLRGLRALASGAGNPDRPLATWLAQAGQTPAAIHRLWEVVAVGVLNCPLEEASAQLATRALALALLGSARDAALGFFRWPLGELAQRAVAALEARGVRVELGLSAQAVIPLGQQLAVRLGCGRTLRADRVVLAVPHDQVARLLPEGWRRRPPWSRLEALGFSPIVNVYLWYDRPVMDGPVAALAQSPAQFVFNRGAITGPAEWEGRWLAVSISAAEAFRHTPKEALVELVEAELGKAFPRLRQARRLHARVIWQPRATFRARVGIEAVRPAPVTDLAGCYLAGDWTATGWPASLESAVRSGIAAARSGAEVSAVGAVGRGAGAE